MDNQSAVSPVVKLEQNQRQPLSQPTQTPPTQQPSIDGSSPASSPSGAGGKKKIIIFLIVLILAFLTAGFLWFQSRAPKLAAKVGSERITLQEVATFALDCDISEKEAVEYLVDEKVLTQWTQDEKITVTPDVQEAEETNPSEETPELACAKVMDQVNLLRQRLSQETSQYREGKFIVVNFGHYNPSSFAIVSPEATEESQREELLKEERGYANNLVQSIYNDLKAGKLTFEQAIEKVNQDTKVGTGGWYASADQSGPFTSFEYNEKRGLLKDELVREKVDALSKDQFSEPFIQKVNIIIGDAEPQFVEARWIIAKVERIGKDGSNIESLLAETREKYQVKIYLK